MSLNLRGVIFIKNGEWIFFIFRKGSSGNEFINVKIIIRIESNNF